MALAIERYEALIGQAEAAWRRGEAHAAFAHYLDLLKTRMGEEAGFGREGTPGAVADLVVVERLSDLSLLLGESDAARALLDALAGYCEEGGNAYGAAFARLKAAHLEIERGRLEECQARLERIAVPFFDLGEVSFEPAGIRSWERLLRWPDASPAGQSLLLALFQAAAGRVLAALGQSEEAGALLERSLVHAPPGASGPAGALGPLVLLERARTELLAGRFEMAEGTMDRVRGVADAAYAPGLVVQERELRAKLALIRGDFGEALRNLRAALELCETRGFVRAARVAGVNLAGAMILANQAGDALDLLDSIAERARKAGDEEAIWRAEAAQSLARARMRSSTAGAVAPLAFATAGPSSGEPRPERPEPKEPPASAEFLTFFEDRALGFQRLLGDGRLPEAATSLARLQETFGEIRSPLIMSRLDGLTGMLACVEGRMEAAEASLVRAMETQRRLGALAELWQTGRFLRTAWQSLGRPSEGIADLERELDALLDAMRRSLQGPEQAIFLLNKWTHEEEELAREADLLERLREQARTASWLGGRRARQELRARLHGLLERLEERRGLLARRFVAGTATREEAKAARPLWRRWWGSPRDRATLTYLVLPDRTVSIVSGFRLLDLVTTPTTRLELRELVRAWHREREPAALARTLGVPSPEALRPGDRPTRARVVAGHIAQAIGLERALAPVSPRVRALDLVADDALHGLPFAVLPHAGEMLVQRYALARRFEDASPEPSVAAGPCRALVLGVAGGTREVPPLPGAAAEAERTARWFGKQGVEPNTLRPTVGQSEFLHALAEARYAHLACHGRFEADRPGNTGLVLVPDSNKPEIVSLRDLATLDLRSLRHLTLSACWSADAFVLPGRWIVGLAETVSRSGAQRILASLWEVDDQTAQTIMELYYAHLGKRLPPDEALRQAQLTLIGQPGTADPYLWAGYCVYGSVRPLEFAGGA